MSRCDHVVGLSPRGKAMVTNAEALPGGAFDGLGGLIPLTKWRLADGSILTEYVQADPWSGGPWWFLNLRSVATQEPVDDTDWTDQEMADVMGECYDGAIPTPSPEDLAWWQELLDDGAITPGGSENDRVHLPWSSTMAISAAIASGALVSPPANGKISRR